MNPLKYNINIIGLLVLLMLQSTVSALTDGYPKNTKIDVLNYIFNLELSDVTDEILCEAVVDVKFLDVNVKTLRLDLIKRADKLNGKGMKVSNVLSNGQDLKFSHINDELVISLPELSQQHQRLKIIIKYKGVPATGLKIGNNKYGDRTFFSDNWPNRGRHWLPIIDHPYDKAMCEFIVTAPSHYQVVSNGLKIEETNLNDDKKLTHWKQSVPIASWLYVLGVADFAVQYVSDFDGKSIQTWVFKQDRDAGFYDFSVDIEAELMRYKNWVVPSVLRYIGNWAVPFKERERGVFTATLYDFNN